MCLYLRLAVYQSSSSGVSIRSLCRCCPMTIHCSQRQALLDMERPWHKLRRCCARTQGVHYLLPGPENSRCRLRILCHAKHHVEVYPGTYSTLWGTMGGCGEEYEDAGETTLTFEEFVTALTQGEASLNSRPLAPLPCDGDTVEPLTPCHDLIGRPLEALPDPSALYCSISLLRHWYLWQHMIQHFWKRWTAQYIGIIRRFVKWHHPSRNLQVGDVAHSNQMAIGMHHQHLSGKG